MVDYFNSGQNYFYFDQNGQKQGPVDGQQLQTLVTQGMITAESPLETESGEKGAAKQVPGLKFAVPGEGKKYDLGLPHARAAISSGFGWFIAITQNLKSKLGRSPRMFPVIMGILVILYGGLDFIGSLIETGNFNNDYRYYERDIHKARLGYDGGLKSMLDSSGKSYTRGGSPTLIDNDKSDYMHGLAYFLNSAHVSSENAMEKLSIAQNNQIDMQKRQIQIQLKQRLLLDVVVVCFGTLLILQSRAFEGNRTGKSVEAEQ